MLSPFTQISDEVLSEFTSVGDANSSTKPILGMTDPDGKEFLFSEKYTDFHCSNSLYFTHYGPNADLSISIPSIIQSIRRGESVIVFSDSTRAHEEYTAEFARKNGYTVRSLNFNKPDQSHSFDLIGAIQGNSHVAAILAKIIMTNTETTEETDIYAPMEQDLLSALLLLTSLSPFDLDEPGKRDLTAIHNVLCRDPNEVATLLAMTKDVPEMSAVWNSTRHGFLQCSDKLRANICSGLKTRVEWIAAPKYANITSTPDVDLTLPAKEKCIYYISTPANKPAQALCACLQWLLLKNTLDVASTQENNGLCPVPVNVVINNPCDVGCVFGLELLLTELSGRNVTFTFMIPSKDAFDAMYGAETLVNMSMGCSVVGCLSPYGAPFHNFTRLCHDALGGPDPYAKEKRRASDELKNSVSYLFNVLPTPKNKLLLMWRRGWTLLYPVDIQKFYSLVQDGQ